MERSKIGLFLAKVETTYGTDANADATSNNIPIARGLVPIEEDGDPQDRDILDAGFGKVSGSLSMKRMTFKVQVELRGNRTDGSTPDISAGAIAQAINIDPLLRACDLAAAYTAESAGSARDGMVIYTPTVPTDAGTSLSITAYSEKKSYVALGCKGTLDDITIEAGKFAKLNFTFQGLHYSINSSSIPASPTWLDCKPPLWTNGPAFNVATAVTLTESQNTVNYADHGLMNGDRVQFGGTVPGELNTSTWYYVVNKAQNTFKVATTLGGALIDFTTPGSGVTIISAGGVLFDGWTGPVISAASFKLGQVLQQRADGNITDGLRGFVITDRDGSVELDPESVADSTHPFWTDFSTRRNKQLRISLGTQTGNRVTIEALTAINKISYEDRSGRRIQRLTLPIRNAALGETPGSEFKLIFQ